MPFPEKRQSSSNQYFKVAQGNNRVRLLQDPIEGWVSWKDKTPTRARDKADLHDYYDPSKKDQRPKFFWACPVWSYEAQAVMIWEFTQATIQDALIALNKNVEDWGNPSQYDIVVTRSGSTMEDTEYAVMPSPKKPLPQEAQDAWDELLASGKFDINLLFEGGDPFDASLPF